MVTEKLLVVVIVTPNSARHVPLLKMLKGDERFEIKTLSATMLDNNSDLLTSGVNFTQDYSEVFEGRKLTNREIGCANSHNLARAMISENPLGGVILEDDARITNIDYFYTISINFLHKEVGNPIVLSLTGFRLSKNVNSFLLNKDCRAVFRMLGKSDLAVAYVLTQESSRILNHANVPILSVSDWPESECTYYALLHPAVFHGDQYTKSYISLDQLDFRKGVSFLDKMKLFTFYSLKEVKGVEFKAYLKIVFWNRITWHLDSLAYTSILKAHRFTCK